MIGLPWPTASIQLTKTLNECEGNRILSSEFSKSFYKSFSKFIFLLKYTSVLTYLKFFTIKKNNI